MKRKKTVPSPQSLKLVLVFGICVAILIVASLILKSISILAKSKFDGQHRFTIAVIKPKSPITLLSFASETSSISILHVHGGLKAQTIGKDLETPIDSFIFVKETSEDNITKEKIEPFVGGLVWKHELLGSSLTILDAIRLFLFTRSVHANNTQEKELFLPKEESAIDKLSSGLFTNSTIAQEKMSIEIVNGTGVSGLGNRLARLISNMGGNVISISTSDSPKDQSQLLYVGEKTYTVDTLSSVLNIKAVQTEKPGLSDIVITIGKKDLDNVPF